MGCVFTADMRLISLGLGMNWHFLGKEAHKLVECRPMLCMLSLTLASAVP